MGAAGSTSSSFFFFLVSSDLSVTACRLGEHLWNATVHVLTSSPRRLTFDMAFSFLLAKETRLKRHRSKLNLEPEK